MRVYLIRKDKGIDAKGEYDFETKKLTVFKGSRVSQDIARTKTFRGTRSIEKTRQGTVKNCIVQKNVDFTSSSTAANFVTGTSTNGLQAWRDEQGHTLQTILNDQKEKEKK